MLICTFIITNLLIKISLLINLDYIISSNYYFNFVFFFRRRIRVILNRLFTLNLLVSILILRRHQFFNIFLTNNQSWSSGQARPLNNISHGQCGNDKQKISDGLNQVRLPIQRCPRRSRRCSDNQPNYPDKNSGNIGNHCSLNGIHILRNTNRIVVEKPYRY